MFCKRNDKKSRCYSGEDYIAGCLGRRKPSGVTLKLLVYHQPRKRCSTFICLHHCGGCILIFLETSMVMDRNSTKKLVSNSIKAMQEETMKSYKTITNRKRGSFLCSCVKHRKATLLSRAESHPRIYISCKSGGEWRLIAYLWSKHLLTMLWSRALRLIIIILTAKTMETCQSITSFIYVDVDRREIVFS